MISSLGGKDMLTGDMLRRSALRFPNKKAIIFKSPEKTESITYHQLDRRANQLGNSLLGLALPKASTISILSRNVLDYGTVFFGVARTGYVLNNISILYAADELIWVLQRSDTDVLIFDTQFLEKVDAIRNHCPRIKTFISIGDEHVDWATPIDSFFSNYPQTAPDINLLDTDPFCMTYTGGTTGKPKGVLVNHRARAVTAHTVVVEEHLDPNDVIAIVTPLFHVAALNIMFQPGMMIGATTVFCTPWSPAHFASTVESEKVTAAFMVPTQASSLITHPDLDRYDLSSWTKLSFAGAPMPDWVQLELNDRFPQLKLTQIYGQSEMGVITSLHHTLVRKKLGSVGLPSFNVDVAIFKSDGSVAQPGEPGEIASRGDNLMMSYYNEPEQTAAFFKLGNGWGLSGDVGIQDEDGMITLIDRAKDMLISGGENVYPKEIEQVLYELEQVAECAVFGIPDEKWGEVAAAYIQLKPGMTLHESAVIHQCEQRLARLKRPRLIKFVDQFPKTPIGKIQKNILKEPYWAGRKKI